MNYVERYERWKTDTFFDMETREELSKLNFEKDKKEIEDRFYRDLEFGTGGLRGVMGAGTNRMNKYTVGKATVGIGKYLLDKYGVKACQTKGVIIGYDTRKNSEYFAQIVADILSGMGIYVYLHSQARPTPQLSFSVRYFKSLAGIVITASHNPKEYNGYKVYDKFGGQIVPTKAKQIIAYINAIKEYHEIVFTGNPSLINRIDVTEEFVDEVLKQSCYSNKKVKSNLRIVYTPLHGTGEIPVKTALKKDDFDNVEMVLEQSGPNGDFPTVVSPNPEDPKALKLGIIQAEKIGADIVLGTDPDCDRVGIAVRTCNGYQLMTGNQIGALLMDFVLENIDLTKMQNPAIVKTIVTSELGAEIARKKGLDVFSTLTGFKYIGEKITQFENAKINNELDKNYDFLMGYEESYGYLVGTHARDKDAVVASVLICEMAAKLKSEGKTLLNRMDEIYAEFGYYRDALDSYTLKGKDGLEKISSIMDELRREDFPFEDVVKAIDYNYPVKAEAGFGFLPTSNVLKYFLSDRSWVAIRPSGTEPKIKIYYSIIGENKIQADKKLKEIQARVGKKLKLEE